MHGGEREHEGQLAGEVAIARRVEAVGGDGVEAERLLHVLAVDRQARAGDRAGAERQDVGPLAAVGQPFAVAAELLAPGQQLMGREHGLRPPHVGVARYDEALLPLGEAEKSHLKRGQAPVEPVDRPPAVEPQVGGHLVVAAAGRMELAAGVAEPGRERRLDVQVDVFLGGGELEPSGPDLASDILHHVGDRVGLLHAHQAAGREHAGVGDRAVDVVVGQPAIERNALRKRLDPLVGRLAKHAAPGLGGGRCGRRGVFGGVR